MPDTDTCENELNVPGHLLFVLGFGIPDSQLTGQSLHTFFRLEEIAKHTFQVIFQRSRRRRRGRSCVGRFGGFSHHHHHLWFGRGVEAHELLPPFPEGLQQQRSRDENRQRQHDNGQRHDKQFQHQRFDGQQYGDLGQEQRRNSSYHGLH